MMQGPPGMAFMHQQQQQPPMYGGGGGGGGSGGLNGSHFPDMTVGGGPYSGPPQHQQHAMMMGGGGMNPDPGFQAFQEQLYASNTMASNSRNNQALNQSQPGSSNVQLPQQQATATAVD